MVMQTQVIIIHRLKTSFKEVCLQSMFEAGESVTSLNNSW